jgi:hypothetical protein
VLFLNSQPAYSRYFTASSALGVITSTVNATPAGPLGATQVGTGLASNLFLVTYGAGAQVFNQFYFSVSGSMGNSTNIGNYSVAVVGVSTITATTQFVGGTGYKGVVPGYVPPS